MMLLNSFKRRYSGSSILESVIAIAIISVCTLVALNIYLNVIQKNNSTGYYEAIHKVKILEQESFYEKDYTNNIYDYKSYKIEKNVTINKNESIAVIEWKIISGSTNKTISSIIPYYENTN